MALRVLLADESSTIKKVMLLALQDYGVDVKSVPVGLDVLAVAKTYKPDIVFADVLLTKRSGYDVGRDLKSDTETQRIPVILMWSGFMELDEARARASMADDRLEKPFDAEILRGLVRKYVAKTQTNTVSSFLSFPPMPEFQDIDPRLKNNEAPGDALSLDADEEEFSQVPLYPQSSHTTPAEENWTQQALQNIKSDKSRSDDAFPATKSGPAQPGFDQFMIPESDLGEIRVQSDGEFEEVTFGKKTLSVEAPKATMSATETVLLERVAREEARAAIESICWKVMPEIIERVVREEISKILKQAEKEL